MTDKYVPRSAAQFLDEDGETSLTADTVIEQEDHPIHTGLYDLHGNPLYRVRDRIAFGFVSKGGAK